jgi:hypothetical protein
MLRFRNARRPADAGQSAAEEARRLALEVAGLAPQRTVDVMRLGVVLEPGECPWRDVTVELRHFQGGAWTPAVSIVALVTDRRILVKLPTGQITSLWWGSLVGFEPCLSGGYVVLDYGDGAPRMLSGRQVATIAVVGVAALYGVTGLAEHPALEPLRAAL